MRVPCACSERVIRWPVKKDISFAKSPHTRTFVSSGTIHPAVFSCFVRLVSVAQRKDIKRQKERLEALKKEAEQEKLKAKEAARQRVLADFEKGQLGLAAAAAGVTTSGGSEVAGTL
jgi:hypothetical protein